MKKFLLYTLLVFLTLGQAKAQLSPARQDFSLKFNEQYVVAPVTAQLNLGSEFTMSCWINPSMRTPYAVVMGKPAPNRGQDPYMSYVIGWNDNGTRLEFVQTTGAAGSYRSVTAPSETPLNTWTHVAATLQNGTMRLYINGQQVSSGTSPGTPPVNQVPFTIGGGRDGANFCCGISGNLMQASVWSKALNGTEIGTLAENIPAPSTSGLVAFWKMNEGSGQTVQDISGNNIHLQLGTTSTADNQDPTWEDNFVLNNGPFFKLHQNELSIQYPLSDIYPFLNNSGKQEFIGTSLQWPPLPPPGAFRPLEYLSVDNNVVIVKTSEILTTSPQIVHARHTAQGDLNGDGLNDLIVIGHGTDTDPFPGEQSLIFIQQADGSLKDETASRLPLANDFTHHVAVGDVDKDGDLDIYMANINGGTNGPRLLHNNGAGVFSVAPTALPSEVANRGKVYTSSAMADLDNDGDLDIYLGADEHGGPNLILFNDGQGHFEIKSNSQLNKYPDNTWIGVGVAIADFDNDGDLDIISNNTKGSPFYQGAYLQLLLNDGSGNFTDHSELLPEVYSQNTTSQEWVIWIDTVDINNDGWLDLITKGNQVPSKLFINYGGTFKDMTHLLPAGFSAAGGFRAGDFDLDGDQDLLAVSDKTGYVLENITLFTNSIANISTSGKTNYCASENINTVLTAYSGQNYTYQWLKDGVAIEGAIASSLTATATGAYSVVTKNGDYPAVTSLPITIKVATGFTASITQDGNKLIASIGTSYKWYFDGELLPSITGEITPDKSGTYTVEVFDQNGCASSSTYEYSLTTGIEDFTAGTLLLYPNPTTNGELFLTYDDTKDFHNATVQVLNLQGKLLLEKRLQQKESKLSLPKAKGMYIIRVIKSNNIYVTRVIRN